MAFGEARGGNKQLAAEFGVTEFPRLVAVCNGDASTAEVRRRCDIFLGSAADSSTPPLAPSPPPPFVSHLR